MTDRDLRKLRVRQALDECGTVAAAAERLCTSPSPVSQQLSSLARQLGAPMLEPYGRRVRLTGAARLVLRHAERVFGRLEQAEAELAGYLHGEAGEVRVGAFATAITGLLVPAVAGLRSAAPELVVRVVEAEAAEEYGLLAAGKVELAPSLAVQLPAVSDPPAPAAPRRPPGHPGAAGRPPRRRHRPAAPARRPAAGPVTAPAITPVAPVAGHPGPPDHGGMLHQMRGEYGPGGASDGVRTWHMVRGESDVAMCGRQLDPGAPVQEAAAWGDAPDLNCHTCGAVFLREQPYLPGEHVYPEEID